MLNLVSELSTPTNSDAAERFLSGLAEVADLGVLAVTANGHIQFLNEAMGRWLGWQQGDEVPRLQALQPHLYNLCFGDQPADSDAPLKGFDTFSFTLKRKGLSEGLPCEAIKLPLSLSPGVSRSDCVLLCWFRPGSPAEKPAETPEALIQALVGNAPIGIFSLDEQWECQFANLEACQLSGMTREELEGRGWTRLFAPHEEQLQTMIHDLLQSGVAHVELERTQHAAGSRVLQLDVRASTNEEGGLEHAVCALIDVTDRVERQQEIHRLANFDSVTGLQNRLAMKHQLERYLAMAKRLRQKVQVLFIDLDGFKSINDLYGHALGDQLLVQVAQRLTRQIRHSDTVARFGGDEFVVIIPGEIPDDVVNNIAEKLNAVLRHPYLVADINLHLTASIGISSFQGDERSEHVATEILRDELLKQADLAMYAAKNKGKNQYRRFNIDHGEEITLAYTIGQQLPRAIEECEIGYHYQPILDNASGRLIGVEALMRWHDEKMGWVNPEVVINVAEANGKIIELQHYMIHCVIHQFEALLQRLPASLKDLRLSINICAIQLFDFKYAEFIAESFKATRFGTSQVTLELTESTLIEDRPEVYSNLDYLKEQGFKVALDDFGTGYSSLSYLTKFPIDIVKLDKSFIWGMQDRAQQQALIDGCVTLAHSLGMQVVAEGVESAKDLHTLEQMGCDFTQGYYHSKPLDMENLYAWIDKQNSRE